MPGQGDDARNKGRGGNGGGEMGNGFHWISLMEVMGKVKKTDDGRRWTDEGRKTASREKGQM
jgi:hypothetical protein